MIKQLTISVIAAISISGCSQSVPPCGDSDSTELVKQIANDEMINQLGAKTAEQFEYDVIAIRTTHTNEQTGAHECAAELDISSTITGKSESIPIEYTVEATDDGEHIYVNVFGL
ncbi:hypothetical protein WCN91_13270 [Pseudoalteromonas sp. YIC-827]|uniref:Uncharacterized protein n=1 Tax=Pseudoalteromonas qingdaonensis TaxID=3131913 RepID=A0ABU9MZ60_9GAMM